MAEAVKLMIKVRANRARPAAISAEMPKAEESPTMLAMRADTELPPVWRMWRLAVKTGEMIRITTMVSPRARPSPSMVPPMIPPFPKGSTTDRIIPHRVAPRA